MRSPLSTRARGSLAAGLVLCAGSAAASGVRLGLSVASPDVPSAASALASAPCAVPLLLDGPALDALGSAAPEGVVLREGLPGTDAARDLLARELTREAPRLAGVVFELPSSEDAASSLFQMKQAVSMSRGLAPAAAVAIEVSERTDLALLGRLLSDPTLVQDVDALLLSGVPTPAALVAQDPRLALWRLLPEPPESPAPEDAARALFEALRSARAEGDARAFLRFGGAAEAALLCRAEKLLAAASPDRRSYRFARPDGTTHEAVAYFDDSTLAPTLFFLGGEAGTTTLDLTSGGPYGGAEVIDLHTGASRSLALKAGARSLALALPPFAAVRLTPAEKPGQTSAAVSVPGVHELTAEEIVARERAWKAAQDSRWHRYTADLSASLRFHVADVNETFDLTIDGPLFAQRGKGFDWAWKEFFVNGVRWKGKTLPQLPILQPDKVTTLPLEIEMSENYSYRLAGTGTVDGRRAYEIEFTPKGVPGTRPIYRGTAWIDTRTFALLKRRTVQLNLKGDTLSSIETEIYLPVPGNPDVVLPLEILGEQVFSTAGRTTAIERKVTIRNVALDPADFDTLRAKTYASPSQMVRDTDEGLRYLVPDAQHPGGRVVQEHVSKKSLFGAGGFFYDRSLNYPIPLAGIQYFNFDLWGKDKQVSLFFAGALLSGNYTDPSFLGSRFDVGADIFAVAIPFGDEDYRNGKEVKEDRLRHVPALFQVNIGHPLGPYLKASLGLFAKWDDYQRDKDTAPSFVTPADTITDGAELRLTANASGYSASLKYGRFHRLNWRSWGIPGQSEYQPSQQDYDKYSVELSKDVYFSDFRKLHASLSYLGGSNLDRFSRYEFGSFSGNPLRGYQSGALRTEQAWLLHLSYGLNIEDIIRLEGMLDQAVINDRVSGFHHSYYSGAGISGQLNGPWNNSLVRFDLGVPVVSHGVRGFSASLVILKMF